jgi:hypothetical protein
VIRRVDWWIVTDVSDKFSSSMFTVYCRGTQIIRKFGSCSKITVSRRVTESRLHTKGHSSY